MGQQQDRPQGVSWNRELGQLCRNLVTVLPLREVPIRVPEAEPQGNAIMSVRITAAGAVAIALLAFHTAPVSACDERYIKKCEKASASAAAAEASTMVPVAKRKSTGRVQIVVSRRSKHMRFAKRLRAPGFAVKRERGMQLASAASRATTLMPESALVRRFRGFISPLPIAQNSFETLRRPHIVAVNLEPPISAPVAGAAPASVAAEAPVAAPTPAPAPITTAKQDRIAPKPAPVMELASAESKAVTLAEPAPAAKPVIFAAANAAPASMAPQAFVSETPPLAPDAPQSRFSIHQLVLALCGALGAASALRFIVGA